MSLPLELLPAIAALTSSLAAAYSAYKLKNKVEAERHFVSQLSDSKKNLDEEQMQSLINIRNKLAHNIEIKENEISKVTEVLEQYVQMLKEEDKKYINEAILQESIKGRLRYADKIISKIGIEEYSKQKQADA